jgi:CheY-like chemotaxis protein
MTMKHVLIVDDNAMNRKLASAMLKRRGWTSEEVDSGEAALALLEQKTSFDYVLMDISMPGITGDEVCRRLRTIEATRQLRIIAYTAHALESEISEIMCSGFDDIIIKPMNFETLLNKLPE